MNTLRWILGSIAAFMGGGYLLMVLVSNGFRRSFGASENHPLVWILPLVAAALLLGGIAYPSNRLLLHAGAVVAFALAFCCVWHLVAESATVLWGALAYLTAWFSFYGLATLGDPSRY